MQVRARLIRSVVGAVGLAGLAVAPAIAADHAVTIQGFAFSPGAVTVTVGDTVTWTNRDGASHTATADDGSFDTGGIPSNSTDTIRFTAAGEHRYHCNIHPDMTGRVVVQEAATGSGTGSGSGGDGEATPPASDTATASTTAPASPALPTLAFALLALAALSGALGWQRRTAGLDVRDRERD